MRGLKLLRVGGRLVYSTCSLNPIEDEAVVFALLKRCRGSVRIVDVSSMYPALKRASGLYQWKVCDQTNGVYANYESIPAEQKRLYRETMFAPEEQEAKEQHLERAMRFLPHMQDTGGFFVCVLEKVAPIPRAEKEEEEVKEETIGMEEENPQDNKEEEENQENEEEEIDGGDLVGIVKEEQRYELVGGIIFRALSVNRKYDTLLPWNRKRSYFCDSIIHSLESLKTFYGIDDSFEWDLIYSRSESNNILLYVNPTIHRLCLTSQSAKRLKVVNTGLKLFEYNSRVCECAYRICQEGLAVIRKHMTKRIVPVCLDDFKRVLETQRTSADITAFSGATQEMLKELEAGACVFVLNEEAKKGLTEKFPSFERVFEEMGCVVWRGVKNINVLVTETDIETMKRVLTMDK